MDIANVAWRASAVALLAGLAACSTSSEQANAGPSDAGPLIYTCKSLNPWPFDVIGYSCGAAPALSCSSPTLTLPAEIGDDCTVYALDPDTDVPLTCITGRDAGCCIYAACRCTGQLDGGGECTTQ
jgi:hypothetical protein